MSSEVLPTVEDALAAVEWAAGEVRADARHRRNPLIVAALFAFEGHAETLRRHGDIHGGHPHSICFLCEAVDSALRSLQPLCAAWKEATGA